jgi:predicted enzyme related to lactoylglutathione lyase
MQNACMAANLRFFSINADDVEQSRQFYEAVLGWTFEAWGPPEFYLVNTGDGGVEGSVQRRREIVPGDRITTLEATFAVDDVDAIADAVVANGGRIVMERTTIAGVGDLIWFQDPSGNTLGAMRYDAEAQ